MHLTFDDGPTPKITEHTLDLLARHRAKATFFLIGKNAEQHPPLVRRILQEGHTIGNHTWSHVNAWKVPTEDYLEDAQRGRLTLEQLTGTEIRYFRPPYGRLTYGTYHALRKLCRIALWDVLSADFDLEITPEQVWDNVRRHAADGSVVVFHDSVKCEPRMVPALEQTLQLFSQDGYLFESLPPLTEAAGATLTSA
jgi:peptidoglycan-N-acetylglucosamine deacetylase